MGHIVGSNRKKLVILFGLLLVSHSSIAQNGYNYPRPDVPITGSTGSAGVRPVVGFPTASTANFPSSNGYSGSVNPTSPSYGFTNPPRTDSTYATGTGTSTGFSGSRPTANIQQTTGYPAPSGLRKSSTIPSRTGALFGSLPSGPISTGSISGAVPVGLRSQQVSTNEVNEGDYSAIPGQPIVDYPIYTEVPQTSFQCNQQQFPGYYADVDAQCQVYHVCAMNRTYSFLCPNGTIFSQKDFVCVWWNEFDCDEAPQMYFKNEKIYEYSKPVQTQPTPGSAFAPVRTQPAFQARPTTATGSGIYSANVRPTVPSAPIRGVSGGVAPVGTTAFPSGATGSGRFTSPTSTAGAFPTGPPTTVPAFGTTLRGSGFAPIQEATFPSSQVSPTAANREYLPPRRS